MTPEEVEQILQRYANDTCTEAERRFVEKSFDAMRQDQSDLDPSSRQAMQKRLWSKLGEEVGNTQKDKRRNFYIKTGSIAATLLLLIMSVVFVTPHFYKNNNLAYSNPSTKWVKLINTGKDLRKIKLKDGSVVDLHPGGELRFPETFGASREVHLIGEAFFEVTKDPDHPFIVRANEVTTRVLGTSFRIKAYRQQKEVMVAVKTGKVSVYTKSTGITLEGTSLPTKEAIILTPNQQVIYNRKKDEVSLKLVENPYRLQSQSALIINYTNTPVTQILKSLAESYGIDIQYDENILSGCTITSASEMLNEGLYEQVEIICNAIGATYKFSDLSIIIEAKRCK